LQHYHEIYDTTAPTTARLLIENVVIHFNGLISHWVPSYGYSFIYNANRSKGEIINDFNHSVQQMSSCEQQHFESDPTSVILQVANLLSKEILALPNTYESWPPTADQLLGLKTKLPPLVQGGSQTGICILC